MRTGYLCTVLRFVRRDFKRHLPDILRKLFGSSNTGNLRPLRLVDADLVQNGGEFVTIFSMIDVLRIRSEDIDTRVFQTESDILRKLAYYRVVFSKWNKKV